MKNILIVIILSLLPKINYSQSISIQDMEKFMYKPKEDIEIYLINERGFVLSDIEKYGDSTIKVYRKLNEAVYVGSGLFKKDGTFLKNATYITDDVEYMALLLPKIVEAGYKLEKHERKNDNEDDATFSNHEYDIMIVIKYGKNEYNSLFISEKP